MKPEIQPNKVVVLSGSGISAESGLPTFRDAAGLWRNYSCEELASPEGWERHPEAVLDFNNERRQRAWQAAPNAAHHAIAALEAAYEVVVITQNVDELHERAGSKKVIHLHGELAYARGSAEESKRYRIEGAPISIGQLCEDGTQLRPDIVWFGEKVRFLKEARRHVATAARVLVVGTSLTSSRKGYGDPARPGREVAKGGRTALHRTRRDLTTIKGHRRPCEPAYLVIRTPFTPQPDDLRAYRLWRLVRASCPARSAIQQTHPRLRLGSACAICRPFASSLPPLGPLPRH